MADDLPPLDDAPMPDDWAGAEEEEAARALGFHLDELHACHKLFQKTGNPLSVWRAILLSTQDNATGRTSEIPDWCVRYLADVAASLLRLAAGEDFRRPVAPNKQRSELTKALLSPEDAVVLLPAALGLSRPGWNAMKVWRSLWEQRQDQVALRNLAEAGSTKSQGIEEIRIRRGFREDRTVRRRVAELNRLLPLDDDYP
jgi:hypothetical protein